MAQIMPQPFKHPKTGVYYFRKVVPAQFREAAGRREIRISLKTKDLREAKRAYPAAAEQADALLSRAVGGPVPLSHKQVVALAGKWYCQQLAEFENNPGAIDAGGYSGWDVLLEQMQEADEAGKMLEHIAPEVDALLAAEGLTINRASWEKLAEQVFWNRTVLCNTLHRFATGDYEADTFIKTFPEWTPPVAAPTISRPSDTAPQTLEALLDAWTAEAQIRDRTAYEWRRFIRAFTSFLGHENLGMVTKADVHSWKSSLILAGKSPITINNHLSGVRAFFGWARAHDKVTNNPAEGVTIARKKSATKARLPYDDNDAKTLLEAARGEKGAKRWVPWLLALTGARMEEVSQPH